MKKSLVLVFSLLANVARGAVISEGSYSGGNNLTLCSYYDPNYCFFGGDYVYGHKSVESENSKGLYDDGVNWSQKSLSVNTISSLGQYWGWYISGVDHGSGETNNNSVSRSSRVETTEYYDSQGYSSFTSSENNWEDLFRSWFAYSYSCNQVYCTQNSQYHSVIERIYNYSGWQDSFLLGSYLGGSGWGGSFFEVFEQNYDNVAYWRVDDGSPYDPTPEPATFFMVGGIGVALFWIGRHRFV